MTPFGESSNPEGEREEQKREVKKCPSCGSVNPSNANFCWKDGTNLETGELYSESREAERDEK